jgi:hypothetical protein
VKSLAGSSGVIDLAATTFGHEGIAVTILAQRRRD